MNKKLQHQKFKLTPVKLVSIILISTFMAWVVYSVSAATSSISLASNKSTVNQGDSFLVTISVNTDTPAVYSTAKVKYNSSQIVFQGVDYSSSAYPTEGPDTKITDGAVTISRYIIPDQGAFPNGKFTLAKLNFQAKSGFSGTSSITVEQNGSEVFGSNGVNILSSVSGANVAVAKPTTPTGPTTPTNPTVPPTSNPAGPVSSNSGSPSAPRSSTPPSNSSHSSATHSEEPESAPATPSIEENYIYDQGSNQQETLKPGQSRLATEPTIAQRLLKMVKVALPVLAVSAIAGGVLWFGLKIIPRQAFGFGGMFSGSHGVGSVTPPSNIIEKPTTGVNQTVNKPASTTPTNIAVKTDPNDHTPRTFSGV